MIAVSIGRWVKQWLLRLFVMAIFIGVGGTVAINSLSHFH